MAPVDLDMVHAFWLSSAIIRHSMQWNDSAIILSVRKHGENSAVLRVLAQGHGVFAGVARGVHSKAMRGVIQPGNRVSALWQARLAEQLGTFGLELARANAARVMDDAGRLAALASACALMEAALPERHPYPRLYARMAAFLDGLEGEGWQEDYVRLELAALAESGFGLDLSRCAGTGQTADLCYVSPRSGRAVSARAGAPYADKLLPLPAFLLSGSAARANPLDFLAGMALTGYFLEHWLLAPNQKKMPAARARLTGCMQQRVVR